MSVVAVLILEEGAKGSSRIADVSLIFSDAGNLFALSRLVAAGARHPLILHKLERVAFVFTIPAILTELALAISSRVVEDKPGIFGAFEVLSRVKCENLDG